MIVVLHVQWPALLGREIDGAQRRQAAAEAYSVARSAGEALSASLRSSAVSKRARPASQQSLPSLNDVRRDRSLSPGGPHPLSRMGHS